MAESEHSEVSLGMFTEAIFIIQLYEIRSLLSGLFILMFNFSWFYQNQSKDMEIETLIQALKIIPNI